MPGVTVTVLDVDKNVTHTYTQTASGLYDTGSIVPDNYTLTFTKAGFETMFAAPSIDGWDHRQSTRDKVGVGSHKVVVKRIRRC